MNQTKVDKPKISLKMHQPKEISRNFDVWVGSPKTFLQFLFQNIGEDVMMGSLMSSIGASFVHLKIGGVPAFLPIPLHSLQLGPLNGKVLWSRIYLEH